LAQHISRKELKKDEVRDTLAHGAEAILSHQRSTLYLAAIAIVIALAIYGWRTYSEQQNARATAGFYNAMNVFNAAIGAPTTPGQPTYSDAKKKFGDAQQKFAGVASKYPRTRSGQLARYYEALSLEKLSRNDEAKQALRGLLGSHDQEVAAMAKFELAKLDDLTGQGDEAVKYYQELIDKPSVLVPKAVVMLALAEHYSQKDPTQAAKVYAQIKSEYPDTAIAEQADQELALLPGKS
jgi:predicted negative regulator of RcsB-dependent stress response